MPVTYRQADSSDLTAGARVVQSAMNDLRPRYGLPPLALPPSTEFPAFWLASDPKGLCVAEEDEKLIGWSLSWMQQNFWFLSQLDVLPEKQGKGIGQALLSEALNHATRQRAKERALITYAFNTHSIGLYARNGFLPHVPLYSLSAITEILAERVGKNVTIAYLVRPLQEVTNAMEHIARIDEKILEFRRDTYHEFLCRTGPTEGMVIMDQSGEPIGYCYISNTGHIGPMAIEPAANVQLALQAVIRKAITPERRLISIIVPGPSDALMRTAIDLGFRITEPLLLMANQPFGNWHCYAPRSPGHM